MAKKSKNHFYATVSFKVKELTKLEVKERTHFKIRQFYFGGFSVKGIGGFVLS
jgi:hypothetical protein